MKQTKFPPVKGTRDFYPEEMAFRNWLFEKMIDTAKKFGYQQYDGPILEPLALYESKSGEELVSKQTYSLSDRGGDKIALRPEMTPTLARMVAQKQNELPSIIRWFNIGQRFRYEQPQKGRFREFYQWDVDLVGAKGIVADSEILNVAADFFSSLGLSPKEIVIKLNDRKNTEKLFAKIGATSDLYKDLLRAVDRKEKMEEKAWKEWLLEIGLTKEKVNNLIKALEDKTIPEDLMSLFDALKILGIEQYFEYDPLIVRGLDYYTGLVFEARDCEGEFRAILGGGRYDNLVEIVGGNPIPGIGFAIGDAVIEEVLKKYNKIPKLKKGPDILVTIFNEELIPASIGALNMIRPTNANATIYPDPTAKLEKQLKYADVIAATKVIIIGPDEKEKGKVTIKNMVTRENKEIELKDLPNEFK